MIYPSRQLAPAESRLLASGNRRIPTSAQPLERSGDGECPKDRFTTTPDGEAGLNYLCPGYLTFFTHIDGPMRIMADLVRSGRYADEIMGMISKGGRNGPCPCGSGRKAKHCHQGLI